MKQLLTLLFVGLLGQATFSQTEKSVESKIKNVTVYQQGAEISRVASVNLKKGKTTLLFKGLSSKLNAKSVRAQGNKNLMIVSISHSIDYLNKMKVSAEIEALENRHLAIKDSLTMIDGITKVYLQEKEMILANKKIGGDSGVNINELQNAASFFRSRLMEIEEKTKQLDKQEYQLKLSLIGISKQLMELNSQSDVPTSMVKLVVSTKEDMKHIVDLKYIINQAGWTPNYDIRIADVNEPMNLFYKAKVYQNSDEDWNNVNMILSTGNPNISNYKPELNTYYLTFNNFYKRPQHTNYNPTPYAGWVYGRITDADTGEALPGVTIVAQGTQHGTVSDMNGEYRINMPAGNSILVYSFIGMQTHVQRVNSGQINVALKNDAVEMDEVVVMGYGGSKGVKVRGASSIATTKKEHIPLAIEKRQTSTEFEIEIPYSIPSDNQPYDVTMVEYQVPAQYNYSAVPKLSDDAYLTAKIPDWTNYEMVSGPANLFFQGIFQGDTYLDLKGFEDTLSISVGRDKDILISREIQKDYTRKSIIGTHRKELKTWEISIKNNKSTSVELVLEDQIPISKVDDIKVEQLEVSGAEVNEDDGKLTWKLKLEAKEKKVLIVKYEVKYPKNKKLIVE
ncbi:DUF4139 domain-containing protein [Carboxylicivirga sp. M1479]|uniref:DUF4139 domain-containing protein n=1 Tax=Carboxylicivirga sp. M1479 TaxID=2594476 RepID=UPI0011778886|nr:DUF4139 domain-containing protein [Carboxylicivirga sp. M1479]TRX66320.1 mucoidy inhibitor MuiA family protein [Carboxylicivirga sp. M1479]